jgi:hypothetical protein
MPTLSYQQGAHITEFQVLPSMLPDGRFFWGYVIFTGGHPTRLRNTDLIP